MPHANPLIHAFSQGEVSVDALARVDQERLRLAAQTQVNLIPYTIGKMLMRPGTTYLGSSPSGNQVREISFVKSVNPDVRAGLELSSALLRVWVADTLITRASVATAVSNGTFASSSNWTTTATGGGTSTFGSIGGGSLVLNLPNRGGSVVVDQDLSVAGGDQGTLHALRIVVAWGPIIFQVGSSQGASDYIAITSLESGVHSLAFTPTGGNAWIRFSSVVDRQVTITSVAVESAGVMSLPAPWATGDLQAIQYVQSADVVFLAHPNWQPRRIERRGTFSWSLVKVRWLDGPFGLPGPTDNSITMTPGQAYGNTTLTASSPVFNTTDVDAIFSVDSSGYNATFSLGALSAYAEPIKIFGIEPDTPFTVIVAGTWVGTLQVEYTLLGPTVGYTNFSGTHGSFTTNTGGATVDPGNVANNVAQWYRIGFSAYTSGSAQVTLQSGVARAGGGGSAGGTVGQSTGLTGTGIYRVTSYVSPTVVNVEVLKYPTSLNASTSWLRGQWSGTQGWPTAVGMHDGRLWWGGQSLPAGSVSDNFVSFATESQNTLGVFAVTDANSIQRQIAIDGAVYNINWFTSLTRLVIGTDGAEVSAYADGFEAPLTPTTVQLKGSSRIGSVPVSPVVVDKECFFVSRTGNRLYKLSYSYAEYGYDSSDLMELNPEIGSNGIGGGATLTQLAIARTPHIWVFAVRSDGTCLLFLYSKQQQIQGWVRITSPGSSGTDTIESVAAYPGTTADGADRVYFWVNRTINGSTVRYREKLCLTSEAVGQATTKLLDAGSFFAGPASTVTAAQLAGCTVYAWANGTQLGPITADGSGNIALGASYTNIWVGLAYTGQYQSAKLAYGVQNGTALLHPKVVDQIGVLASNILPTGVRYGKDFTSTSGDGNPMWPIIIDEITTSGAVLSVMDQRTFPFDTNWDTDSRVCLQVSPNTPATFNALVFSVQTNE